MAFMNIEQLAELAESGETPVTLFSDKAVVCVWKRAEYQITLESLILAGARTADGIYSRVVRIGDD